MLKRPIVWIALGLLSIACAAAAYRGFPRAFSIVSIDISMDRSRALADARAIASRDHLGPDRYREAASFIFDDDTQTFVELEGGGKQAFQEMLRQGLYEAYAWKVRHFREGEVDESTITFTPAGRPYGFVERLREDAPGAALDSDTARHIAEQDATARWGVNLAGFRLVEHAVDRRSAGRVDHTFTYERPTPTVGEGRYRLRLVVSGDRLTEVTNFVQVPEAFSRRYESMRSANTAVGEFSVVSMLLLYGVGGVGVGLFLMMRRRWVIWRPAMGWGVVVALLQTLVSVNEWPLVWMSYNTAIPESLFFTQQITGLVASFVAFSLVYGVSFMTAETLTRRAFGSHPQLWHVWSPNAGSSTAILGRTAGGYLCVAAFFAYDVALYAFATRRLGWWSPSEALLHPDVLASYAPWFSAIGNSLEAGFWEECLFRAVPIAGAALIGDRIGHRRLAIVVAFVVQAIVFGSGHAPYPNEPFFARPVELILPSFGFGLLYLYFGLVPGIILHFVFDTIWFALPLFVTHAPGIWFQRLMVVAVVLVPLWIVIWRRVQAGRWTTLQAVDRNAAWQPPAPVVSTDAEAPAPAVAHARHLTLGAERVWMALGIVSLAALLTVAIVHHGGDEFRIARPQAVAAARNAISTVDPRSPALGPSWRFFAAPSSGDDSATLEAQEFVSATAGESRRRTLLGVYLPTPRWAVRVATFEGDLVERAEEWHIFVTQSGEARPIEHDLPEARPGASLNLAEARSVANQAVFDRLGLQAARGDIREISAKPQRLPARTDWTFTFADTTRPPLPQGELRIGVNLAGREVASVGRFVFIPEEWDRRAHATATRNVIIEEATALLPAGLVVYMAVSGLVAWSRKRFAPRHFAWALVQIFLITIAAFANRWPMLEGSLSTSQPLSLQVGGVIGISIVGTVISSAVLALIIGALPNSLPSAVWLPEPMAWRLGAAAGCIGAAVIALSAWLRTPVWAGTPDISALGAAVPAMAVVLDPLSSLFSRMALLVSILAALGRLTSGWSQNRVLGSLVVLLIGAAAGGAPAGSALGGWLIGTALVAVTHLVLAVFLLSFDLTTVPVALGVMAAIVALLRGSRMAYPGALTSSVVAAVVVLFVAGWWFRALRPPRLPAVEESAVAA